MRKHFLRWYEKNEYLNAFLGFMQNIDSDEQYELAIDMLIKISDISERKYSSIISELSYFDPKDNKRWYDKNPNVHLAVESLKDLTSEQVEYIVQEFTDRVLASSNISLEEYGV